MNIFKITLTLTLLSACLNSEEEKKSLKVAFLDTGFCLEQLPYKKKNIFFKNTFHAAPKLMDSCDSISNEKKAFHGHFVLTEFLTHLNTHLNIEITPISLFDFKGEQKTSYWHKALQYINEQQFDLVVAAIGLPLANDEPHLQLPTKPLFLLAAGREGPGIMSHSKLFPQEKFNNKNVLLISNFYQSQVNNHSSNFIDPKMLYQEQTKIFLKQIQGPTGLTGSSQAVTLAAAKIISKCSSSLDPLNTCLKKHLKPITFENSSFQHQKFQF